MRPLTFASTGIRWVVMSVVLVCSGLVVLHAEAGYCKRYKQGRRPAEKRAYVPDKVVFKLAEGSVEKAGRTRLEELVHRHKIEQAKAAFRESKRKVLKGVQIAWVSEGVCHRRRGRSLQRRLDAEPSLGPLPTACRCGPHHRE